MVVTGIKNAEWLAAFLERNRVAILAAAVLVSILLRVWLLSVNQDICPKCGDISNYVAKGKTLAGLNLNFFDPRYDEGTYAPLFEFALAAAIKLFGEGAIPLVAPFFGVLLIVATYFLGTAMFNTPTGVLAAIFVSVHPMLTVFGLVPLVESLFALLLVSAFVFFQKEKFFASGILLGLAYLTKYNGMLAILSLTLYLLAWGGRGTEKRRKLLSLLVGILLVTSPWLLRNYALFGNPFHSSDVPRFLGTVSMAAEKPAGPLLYLAGLPIYVGQPFVLLAALGLAFSLAYWRKFLPILLTIGAFFAFFSLWPTMEFRHMITIVPFIVAFSAYGFLGLSRLLTASSGKHAGVVRAIIILVLAEIIFDNLVATYAFTKALDALVSIGKLLKG